jgi:formate dehydrogenase subunit gamma
MISEKKVVRYDTAARIVHWTNLISILVLLYTGLALYLPATNILAGSIGGFFVSRILHRIAIITLISIPLIFLPFTWDGVKKWLRELFTVQEGDIQWALRFPLYFFRPSLKMPPVLSKMTSGQRVLTLIMLFSVLVQLITGPIMLWRTIFSKSTVLWAYLFHDIGMLIIGIGVAFHSYVGLGGFKPYRGVWRGMFGDGTVDYSRAKYLWPKWTDETVEEKEVEREIERKKAA